MLIVGRKKVKKLKYRRARTKGGTELWKNYMHEMPKI
jgi:hypothetical protein